MSKYRKQDIETLLRLQLGEAEKAKVSAQQKVERLERENKRLFDDWKACRDALKGNINDPDPLPCTDERSLTLYGMVAGVLRSRDDLKQQVAQLREQVRLSTRQVEAVDAERMELLTAHATLRGLVEKLPVVKTVEIRRMVDEYDYEEWCVWTDGNPFADCETFEHANGLKGLLEYRATLPREGATSDGGEHE